MLIPPGAYTNQLFNIDPTYGNALVHLGTINSTMNISLPQTDTWYNNATIANGGSCVVDGAKRDREVGLTWGHMSLSSEHLYEHERSTIGSKLFKLSSRSPKCNWPIALRRISV